LPAILSYTEKMCTSRRRPRWAELWSASKYHETGGTLENGDSQIPTTTKKKILTHLGEMLRSHVTQRTDNLPSKSGFQEEMINHL